MVCELGVGEWRILIHDRTGTIQICELSTNSSAIEAPNGRLMDDTAEVKVTVDLSEDDEEVGKIRSWLHTMTLVRDDEEVWGPGPVFNMLESTDGDNMVITARDASAWLDVREIHTYMTFTNADPVDVAVAIINDAMYPDDPLGIVDALIAVPTAPSFYPVRVTREYTPGSMYAGEALRELARTVLDFTTVGRSIILGLDLSFGPYTPLTDEDFQTALVVEERGSETATKWRVNGDGGTGVAGGVDDYYGLIEQIATEEGVVDAEDARNAAGGRLAGTNPTPLYVSVPQGASLSPRTAVCFRTLVPGALFDIDLRNTRRPVSTQMRLTSLGFKVSATAEEIGVTLSPVGTDGDAS